MDRKQRTSLKIPARREESKPSFLYHTKEVVKWVGELPVANLGETSRRVFKALIDLNREPIPSSTRIRNAELFRQPIDFIAHNLRKYYFDVPLPLSPRNRKIATLTRELYSELATPYKIYLEEADEQRNPRQDKGLIISLHRALSYLGRALYHCALVYDPYPRHVWSEIHSIYGLAEKLRLLDVQVRDAGEGGGSSSVHEVYKQLLLFGASSPYRLRQREIERVFKESAEWQNLTHLAPPPAEEPDNSLFMVHLASDTPPSHISLEISVPDEQCRIFSTRELISHLESEVQGPGIESKGQEKRVILRSDAQGLLERLIQGYGIAPKRRSRRRRYSSEIAVTVGLAAIHEMIHHHFEPAPQEEEMSHFEDDSTVWLEEYQRIGNPGFRDAVNHLKDIKFSLNPNQGYITDEAIIETRNGFGEMGHAPSWASNGAKTEPAEPHTLRTVNESAGGYCIGWEGSKPPQIKVGELIAVQNPGAGRTFSIGVGRWIRNTPAEGLQIGLELIAPSCQAVHLRYAEPLRELERQHAALLLPIGLSQKLVAGLLVVPALPFKLHDHLWLEQAHGRQKIELTKVRESTGAFSLFEFKKSHDLHNTGASEEQTDEANFDTIWDML
ncbi:MAG: hypothetical protein B0D96_04450 [Candidatus Sedimenticola endophacoides]|nr:MAG: hypothetical protein B0D94_05460 [Candidatus Sedimenticola endophacoides]OQX36360.1 MAG: hypothetical protein B0D96_04450 [Candidatus Sedimenticola endophacoides]OQX41034.1 MAG: hypothetical protein B0D88_08110 [Candidatus Sedimenticola endophacoides]OQX48383.1 MAG: hypothetical protein B0D87_06010 [Candidatus Sedimenticola endophacoides]PUE02216.1 MAG: hypothetical protein C3L26_01770 [Candidatus Sedimenticola endophacoides]